MIFIYLCLVIMNSIDLGNSLESTRDQSLSEERYNFFDAELLQVFNQRANSNVLISPISIKHVLGMLLEGAENKTSAEIRAALRLPEEGEARRKEFNIWLSVFQDKKSQNILKVASRLFFSNHYSINPDYEKILTKYYSGGVTSVNFEDGNEASRVINSWVGNQTSHLIPSLVDEDLISPDSKLILASAVYFKGFWSSPFALERSTVRCFYSKDNTCKDSIMMKDTGYFDYGYISRLNAKAIVLPYKGGKFSMLLLLPSKRDGVDLLGRDLVHVSLGSILSELTEEEVFVQIPKFEISYSEDLVEALKSVQISELFTMKANLSKMFTTRLDSISVSHIYHSAKITVNEEGSEAAAATGAMFVPLMGGTTISFVANHPFLFFVMSSVQNSILFAGKVVSPETSEDSKKRLLPLNPVSQSSKKNVNNRQEMFQLSKSPQSHRSQINPSTKIDRGQQASPKFRSMKSTLPVLRLHSNEKKISAWSQSALDGSSHPIPATSVSRPNGFIEKDNQNKKKRGKTFEDLMETRKRQESSADDWRRDILVFT